MNPDFSQIESDVAQISVNERFALFFPEKRPFFLEGVDLLETPITAVYTRTITSPRWGARATGKLGSMAYTVLVTEDRGGGSVIVPGPQSSDLADQDFSSLDVIARVRHDVGRSFVGFLATDRENRGGSHNRVLGPDFQWRPSEGNEVTGQFLYSSTKTPERPDLATEWGASSTRPRDSSPGCTRAARGSGAPPTRTSRKIFAPTTAFCPRWASAAGGTSSATRSIRRISSSAGSSRWSW